MENTKPPGPLLIRRQRTPWGGLAGFSHVGLERESNEDRYASSPDGTLFAVADGMGGHDGGEFAAEAAVGAACAGGSIAEAFERARLAVEPLAQGRRGPRAPGCTRVVVRPAMNGRSVDVGWAGDSRAYLWNGDTLVAVTRDHSINGRLTRCLGGGMGETRPEVVTVDVRSCRWLLVCTDGLHGFVSDRTIAEALRVETRGEALTRLLAAAFRREAPDNLTCVLASFA